MVEKILNIVGIVLFVSGFFALTHYLKEHSPNANDAKLNELLQISKESPVYPTFVKTGKNTSSRNTDAAVYQYFRSKVDFETVKTFYISRLTQNGWTQVENTDELVFRKNDFSINIEHGNNGDWDYAVDYIWSVKP